MPRQASHFLLYTSVLLALIGCQKEGMRHTPSPTTDTLYTERKAMEVYGYQPELALRIIDSAAAAGNLSEIRADLNRADIYSRTLMGHLVDSLLGGSEGVRFDSARIIGERLLHHHELWENLAERQNILEILINTARMQSDTARWFLRSRQLVDVCHQQGAETEALRTEAEIGAALCTGGKQEAGMALLDSVITRLENGPAEMEEGEADYQFRFNELDATIIALKRKICVLTAADQHAEIIPLAHHVIDLLDNYEYHPNRYHDATYREPKSDAERADYIHFYRTKAEGYLTAAYASLGERGNMKEVYEQIERSVRDATAREHIARYQILEQEMLRSKAESRHHTMTIVNYTMGASLVLILLFMGYIVFQNHRIRLKNRALVRLIGNEELRNQNEESNMKNGERETKDGASLPDASFFHHIDSAIRAERLYANPNTQRQDICRQFNIRREMLNQLLANHAGGLSFPAYINAIRLSEACRLLQHQPGKTVNAIAEEVGLSPRNLRRLFIEKYGITPSEYRQGLQK